jgi:thiosulfate/3-mercaptopyruvate sulfurtransferase
LFTTLVSTEELARRLDDPDWRVFDCRHDLGNPGLGAQQYAKVHIPGALFAHLDHDLSAPRTGKNGRHPLLEPEQFAAWLGERGVRPTDQVVAYDANNGTMAARLWWMLRWLGHEAVAVLDGGFAKWIEEGGPLTAQVPGFAPSEYAFRLNAEMAVDVAFVEERVESGAIRLVDARAPARFLGEKEPIDPVAGRIPGAKNRFCAENITADGPFKSAALLRREFGALLGDRAPEEIVHYCGSGVAACHNMLAMEVAGFPGSKVYVGSWSEWIAERHRPQEKG